MINGTLYERGSMQRIVGNTVADTASPVGGLYTAGESAYEKYMTSSLDRATKSIFKQYGYQLDRITPSSRDKGRLTAEIKESLKTDPKFRNEYYIESHYNGLLDSEWDEYCERQAQKIVESAAAANAIRNGK